ncbi:SDR family NAD(P)-dependent oxidoreductase [Deinococcus sp. KNUC1210]|uniref:SDR family NAD(P)-dependent oxidoreductase n=1 Tax=Deinococcus sp. KNUC1210 TaxID=2917691 RepID=UPI001EF0EE3E|nr:SDR family NAD(P)-dependent oxidoreductase [Deinococcus sp. KNUC1210]ULH16475.1 SDR family NAD(P)-dependent oxidoreductase [Deinococcus sp. KNUC1210]
MNSVVVTGVSSGIGYGTVKVLLERGQQVFGSVRRQADAERLKADFGERFTPLLFDVTDAAAVARAAAQVSVALEGRTLSGLVNNAGVAVPAPLYSQTPADFRQQLDINLTGPLLVTQAFLPVLGMNRQLQGPPGRIVNVSSIGAKLSPPFLGAYAASKAGLEALSDSLRRELLPFGIDVLVVAPGSVATPIWDKAEAGQATWASDPLYRQQIQKFAASMVKDGRAGYTPEQIGDSIWRALSRTRPALRAAPGPETPLTRIMTALLPKRALDAVIGRTLGLRRAKS